MLHGFQMELYQTSAEIFLNYKDADIELQVHLDERVLHLVEVDFPQKGSAHAGKPLGTYLLCITTKRILLLEKDIKISYYYIHPCLEKPFGITPTQAFCPKMPKIVWSHPYTSLSRVIYGLSPQILSLGFVGAHGVEHVEVIRF